MNLHFSIEPHPDIELCFNRSKLDYYLTLPDRGIQSTTGVILFISGYGFRPQSEYESEKLRPYLANKYDCIVAGVDYFGIDLKAPGFGTKIDIPFMTFMQNLYGISPGEYFIDNQLHFDRLTDRLREIGISNVDSSCRIVATSNRNEYQSFGFLPALDCLSVLGDIFKRYEVNKRKILAFGTSYGGYIGLLMGKFAPKTFSLIIDNSGFTHANIGDMVGDMLLGHPTRLAVNGINFPVRNENPWGLCDERSEYYLSDRCRYIRSLHIEDHLKKTDTRYYLFHSVADEIVPIKYKDDFAEIIAKNTEVYYWRIENSDIDGQIFKNTGHGMEASLRGLFDIVADKENGDLSKDIADTDFDLNSQYSFKCIDKTYNFEFRPDYSFSVNIG